MPQQAYHGSGTVRMNPLGPHFYVNVEQGEKPPGMVDLMTDTMNHLLTDLNERHGWEITNAHVRGHVDIAEVSWDPNPDNSYGIDLHVEPVEVSFDWYSRSQVHEWDFC